ncbi:alpha/beta hydrolase fold domain-containing protein [Micromonospora echinofusca]|uniref:Alpha/beta hydrolase fold domain-containing protein n=2 Tax=Micromonospora echinofusca TaxID=47858 RepID=A0ABS3VS92_MICEH|nr:alpha/beta hydrolase fold domain-containing protein [Micromonospora echinofusca]
MAVPASTGSLEQDRANAERWIRRFGSTVDPDDGASVVPGEHSQIVRPAQEAADATHVLYIHGGGMVYYSPAIFQPFLRSLANTLHSPVEAFDYLKAPEHTVEQSLEQLGRHVAARCRSLAGRQLTIAGDSVGGLFALYLALRVLPGVFSRIVLIYPVLDLRTERASYRTFGAGHFLDSTAMRLFTSILAPFFAERAFDPFALSPGELTRMPACAIVTAGCDVLRDEGIAWVQHLAERSVPVRHQHFPDLPHDFCLYAGKLASARSAVDQIARTAFHPGQTPAPAAVGRVAEPESPASVPADRAGT